MKPLVSALPFLLLAAMALPVAAAEPVDAKASTPRGKVLLSLAQDGSSDTFQFEELAVGESRQIQGKDGKLVTLTRSADALTIESDGKTTRVQTPASGTGTSQIRVVRHGGDGTGHKRVIVRRGDNVNVDLADLDGTDLDGTDLDVAGLDLAELELALADLDEVSVDVDVALISARTALATIDLKGLDTDLEGLDEKIQAALADARANGDAKVIVLRRKPHDDTATD